MKYKSCIIAMIILLSLMFIGAGCPSTPDTTPPPPPELSPATFNGTWIYLDFTNDGVQYPLEDSLYHETDTEWAEITFNHYADPIEYDNWHYIEHSALSEEYDDVGGIDTLGGGLFLSEFTAPPGEYFVGYNWSVHEDTLILTDYYDPDWFFRLIDAEVWPGWEPDLLDIGYNGDWVFIDYIANGASYPLDENLYNSTETEWAEIEFRNFDDDTWTDTWYYVEQNQVAGNIESNGGDLIDDDGLLNCMYGGSSTLVWEFSWYLETGDTLLLYLPDDSYYKLIPVEAWQGPEPQLKDIAYNGIWFYTDFIFQGSGYPLEDSLYHSPETEWAKLELSDYLDPDDQDSWSYVEQDSTNDDIYSISGDMEADGTLRLFYWSEELQQDVEWAWLGWMMTSDTLQLSEGYSSNVLYSLVSEDDWQGPGPLLKDVVYNDDWVFVDFEYYGTSYPLEDSLYTDPEMEVAKISFRDYNSPQDPDTWTYNEESSTADTTLTGNLEASYNLLLYIYDPVLQFDVLWKTFIWESPQDDTLFLYVDGDLNRKYTLITEDAWQGP
ncbi:hypothetical protein KKA00_00570 [bacterium]|nr:hypothetical protein [bacterium]MBU1650684.1 hypothetical protein [bacterium]